MLTALCTVIAGRADIISHRPSKAQYAGDKQLGITPSANISILKNPTDEQSDLWWNSIGAIHAMQYLFFKPI